VILGCEIRLRMSSSRRADEVMRSVGASSWASRRTSLMASWPVRTAGVSGGWSKGSARRTLENVPRPRDWSFMYRAGERIHWSSPVRQYSRSYRQSVYVSVGVWVQRVHRRLRKWDFVQHELPPSSDPPTFPSAHRPENSHSVPGVQSHCSRQTHS
jgi:hypothetical protein